MLHMTPDKSCQRASGAGVVHSGQLPTLSRGQQRDRQTTNHTYEQFVPRLWEEIIHRDTGNMQNPRTKVASQMVDLIPGPSHCEATVLTHWNLKKINKFKKKITHAPAYWTKSKIRNIFTENFSHLRGSFKQEGRWAVFTEGALIRHHHRWSAIFCAKVSHCGFAPQVTFVFFFLIMLKRKKDPDFHYYQIFSLIVTIEQ